MKNKLILLFLTCFLISDTIIGQTVENEFKKILIPIKSTDPNTSVDDLLPIAKYLKNKKIISVGEANHGAKEFFQIKHRMVQLFVEKTGVKAIGFEISPVTALEWNNYIQNGIGDVDKILQETDLWVWNAAEIRTMLVWLKDFNAKKSPANKVTFYGFDTQKIDQSAMFIKNFIEKNKISIDKPTLDLLTVLSETSNFNISEKLPQPKPAEAQIILAKLSTLLKSKNQKIYKDADYILWSMTAAIEIFSLESKKGYVRRDELMAENVDKIIESLPNKSSQLVLLAHNGHIGKSAETAEDEADYQPCGKLLAKKYGEKYYAIGTDFNKGTALAAVRGKGVSEVVISDEEKNSSGYVYAKTNVPIFFYDMKTAFNNPKLKPFVTDVGLLARGFGAVYDASKKELVFDKGSLRDRFDAVIFVDEISPADTLEPDWGYVVQEIDYRSKKGSSYKVEAKIKTVNASPKAELDFYGLIVDSVSNSRSEIKKAKIDTIKSLEWKKYEIEFISEVDAGKINIGIFTQGKFQLLFDDFKIFEKRDGNWIEVPFKNATFNAIDEKSNKSELWFFGGSAYFNHFVEKESDNNYGVIEAGKKRPK